VGFGQFLSDLYQSAIGTVAATRAAETDIEEAESRIDEAVQAGRAWTTPDVMRVLVTADPLTIVGREDAAELYRGIAEQIVAETSSNSPTRRRISKAFKHGIDAMPGDVRVFIKRGALKTVPAYLAEMAARAGQAEQG
jgi:hypothetical protein